MGLLLTLGWLSASPFATPAARSGGATAAAPAAVAPPASAPDIAPPSLKQHTLAPPSTVGKLEPVVLQADLRASEERLRQAIADNKPSGWEKLLPALLGLFGVFVGGAINVWLQRRQMAASEKAHRATTAFEAQTKIIDYRSRQAHEFYHPLLLMLQRSSGVRRQLCDHLAKKDPDRFRMEKEADVEHLFIYDSAGNRARFRLIKAMYELATEHKETLPMVNEIVAIGEKMSALIHDKGGLVLAAHADLTDLLGRYLAHFSILREVAAKASNPEELQGITYNVLYPIELDAELNKGIAFLQENLERWSAFSIKLWDEAMPGNSMPNMTGPASKSVP
ncbi:hypothetical protein [Xanthomonas sp. CFBP 8445]|uniref:hypothetical protein n=1 Tax=Xanthomonas sp. CFBP 8445 TaxID=2971236 RepID=UPI0021E0F711|nr:hypothetical protein [Xanthomonas sp. CFBP 8445]UYC14043.1 hypothetical protein NUG21_10080 [Xanthomonas sp. CFBP 8445]